MTLNSTVTKVSYAGDGAQTVFDVTFKFLDNNHVTAILRDANGAETTWVEGTQYTLTGAGDENGGTLTVDTTPVDYTPQSGETLVIKRSAPETQQTALPLGGAFSSENVEQALDQLTMLVQAHSEEIARAVLLKATSAQTGISIPDPEAAKFLRWDALAQNLENADIIGGGSIGIPVSVAQGGTGATTAAAARTALGLAIGTDVQADLDVPSQAEAEAGMATDERVWTAERIAQAIAALESGLPRSYLAGFELANNGTDADHDIDIAAGACRDDANGADLVLSSALTKRVDAAWAVGTNQGGLDTGSVVADTWYHVWLIKRSDTGVVDALFSTSATSPTMPTNYDKKRRIGAVLTDGSANILAFSQDGDDFIWNTTILDVNVVNPGIAAVLRALSVPTGIKVSANIQIIWRPQSTGGAGAFYVSSPDVSDEAPDKPSGPENGGTGDSSGLPSGGGRNQYVRTNTSAQVRTRASASITNDAIRIRTVGWVDRRGRDD